MHWHWVLLALLPGLLSVFVFSMLTLLSAGDGSHSESVGALARMVFRGALFMPFAMPFYVYVLGRKYVRTIHAGWKSAFPFAVLYGVANLVLWACGAILLGLQMHTPG